MLALWKSEELQHLEVWVQTFFGALLIDPETLFGGRETSAAVC